MAWNVVITQVDPNGDGHGFVATDSASGEVIRGTVGRYPPHLRVMPKAFFNAIAIAVSNVKRDESFDDQTQPIEPSRMIEIVQESSHRAETVINAPLAKWNGWKTFQKPRYK